MSKRRIAVARDDELSSKVFNVPENRLMLAVLEDALSTFKAGIASPVARRRRFAVEVEQWAAGGDPEWPFSFENICSVLGFDADYIRQGLRAMKRAASQNATSPRLREHPGRLQDRRAWRSHVGWNPVATLAKPQPSRKVDDALPRCETDIDPTTAGSKSSAL